MEFFQAFGISGATVLPELVNFAILLFLLYLIGYKPMLKFVEERTAKIEQGVKNAEQAAKALTDAKSEQEKILVEARKEAAALIEAAQSKAKEQGAAILQKAKDDVAAVVQQGKQTIEADRQKMLNEVKADVITMVIESTEKVLSGAIDTKVDEGWLKKQLAKVKN